MAEYLAPGVYVEETSFRAKSIEGVSTSTAGFIGPTLTGPICGHPELITSFAEFARYYGGLDDLESGVNYLAHGVRAFFDEGGKRCYVMRVYARSGGDGHAFTQIFPAPPPAGAPPPPAPAEIMRLKARFPGRAGNMRVRFTLRRGDDSIFLPDRSKNTGASFTQTSKHRFSDRVRNGDVIFIPTGANKGLYNVILQDVDGQKVWKLDAGKGAAAIEGVALQDLLEALVTRATAPASEQGNFQRAEPIQQVFVVVTTERQKPVGSFDDPFIIGEFKLGSEGIDTLFGYFSRKPSTRFAMLTVPFFFEATATTGTPPVTTPVDPATYGLRFVREVMGFDDANATVSAQERTLALKHFVMEGGSDGAVPQADAYAGDPDGIDDVLYDSPADDFTLLKNGLLAFEAVPDISILAAPGHTANRTEEQAFAIASTLMTHCEEMRYRVAALDTPENLLVSGALAYRNLRSSKYAALYYPWIYVADPREGKAGRRLKLPPSGFVAGIWARNDTEHEVFKAPANEVVRLAIDFEQRLSKAHQEVLNPNGINCFRFFEGRGFLLWGARTISDDPEWKYVNVRRYFAYLEHSIDKGTQWAVFENNNEPLWANIRRTIEDFLYNEWRKGGLMGDKPEKGFFVRCDRSTMTQNDLDNGRLICLIGVAPVKPAEFVIFRIGQWTADSPNA